MPEFRHLQPVPFPRNTQQNIDKNKIQKIFLTKHLTNRFLYTILRIVKGVKPDDRCENIKWGSEVQTPSYILSPLDSGPQDLV